MPRALDANIIPRRSSRIVATKEKTEKSHNDSTLDRGGRGSFLVKKNIDEKQEPAKPNTRRSSHSSSTIDEEKKTARRITRRSTVTEVSSTAKPIMPATKEGPKEEFKPIKTRRKSMQEEKAAIDLSQRSTRSLRSMSKDLIDGVECKLVKESERRTTRSRISSAGDSKDENLHSLTPLKAKSRISISKENVLECIDEKDNEEALFSKTNTPDQQNITISVRKSSNSNGMKNFEAISETDIENEHEENNSKDYDTTSTIDLNKMLINKTSEESPKIKSNTSVKKEDQNEDNNLASPRDTILLSSMFPNEVSLRRSPRLEQKKQKCLSGIYHPHKKCNCEDNKVMEPKTISESDDDIFEEVEGRDKLTEKYKDHIFEEIGERDKSPDSNLNDLNTIGTSNRENSSPVLVVNKKRINNCEFSFSEPMDVDTTIAESNISKLNNMTKNLRKDALYFKLGQEQIGDTAFTSKNAVNLDTKKSENNFEENKVLTNFNSINESSLTTEVTLHISNNDIINDTLPDNSNMLHSPVIKNSLKDYVAVLSPDQGSEQNQKKSALKLADISNQNSKDNFSDHESQIEVSSSKKDVNSQEKSIILVSATQKQLPEVAQTIPTNVKTDFKQNEYVIVVSDSAKELEEIENNDQNVFVPYTSYLEQSEEELQEKKTKITEDLKFSIIQVEQNMEVSSSTDKTSKINTTEIYLEDVDIYEEGSVKSASDDSNFNIILDREIDVSENLSENEKKIENNKKQEQLEMVESLTDNVTNKVTVNVEIITEETIDFNKSHDEILQINQVTESIEKSNKTNDSSPKSKKIKIQTPNTQKQEEKALSKHKIFELSEATVYSEQTIEIKNKKLIGIADSDITLVTKVKRSNKQNGNTNDWSEVTIDSKQEEKKLNISANNNKNTLEVEWSEDCIDSKKLNEIAENKTRLHTMKKYIDKNDSINKEGNNSKSLNVQPKIENKVSIPSQSQPMPEGEKETKRKNKEEHLPDDDDRDSIEEKFGNIDSSESSKFSIDSCLAVKLDKFLKQKMIDFEENSKHGYDSDGSTYKENSCIIDMAEEGEEETPSEDSNQIIDDGESIRSNSERSEDFDSDDSFVCMDESVELLSGDEYDLGNKKKKKRTRILNTEHIDDDIIIINKKPKVEQNKKKKSRIIRFDSSSSDELFEDKHIDSATQNKAVDHIKNEETLDNNSPTEKSDVETTSRNKKSSITIIENVDVKEIKDAALSERINQLIDSFCTTIPRQVGLEMNLSLEYNDRPKLKSLKCPLNVEESCSKKNESICKHQQEVSTSTTADSANPRLKTKDLKKKRSQKKKGGKALKFQVSQEKQKKREKSSKKLLKSTTFGLLNQLITDVKNRPSIIEASKTIEDINTCSTIQHSSRIKPSTSILTNETIQPSKKKTIHMKDFRTQMLYNSSRVKRIDVNNILRKKGAYY